MQKKFLDRIKDERMMTAVIDDLLKTAFNVIRNGFEDRVQNPHDRLIIRDIDSLSAKVIRYSPDRIIFNSKGILHIEYKACLSNVKRQSTIEFLKRQSGRNDLTRSNVAAISRDSFQIYRHINAHLNNVALLIYCPYYRHALTMAYVHNIKPVGEFDNFEVPFYSICLDDLKPIDDFFHADDVIVNKLKAHKFEAIKKLNDIFSLKSTIMSFKSLSEVGKSTRRQSIPYFSLTKNGGYLSRPLVNKFELTPDSVLDIAFGVGEHKGILIFRRDKLRGLKVTDQSTYKNAKENSGFGISTGRLSGQDQVKNGRYYPIDADQIEGLTKIVEGMRDVVGIVLHNDRYLELMNKQQPQNGFQSVTADDQTKIWKSSHV